jgi:hypothetical protein
LFVCLFVCLFVYVYSGGSQLISLWDVMWLCGIAPRPIDCSSVGQTEQTDGTSLTEAGDSREERFGFTRRHDDTSKTISNEIYCLLGEYRDSTLLRNVGSHLKVLSIGMREGGNRTDLPDYTASRSTKQYSSCLIRGSHSSDHEEYSSITM